MSTTADYASKMRTLRTSNGCVRNSANTAYTSPGEEVRTLFVSGLPMDVRLRELYLLFRCYEGYEGSFLKLISSKPGKTPQPIAFVSFSSRKHAEKALEELQGIHFDPASAQTLRLEFARTNSRVSPKQQVYTPQQSLNLANASTTIPHTRNGQYLYYIVSSGSPQLTPGSGTYFSSVNTGGQNMMTLADCWAPTRMHNIVPSVSYTNMGATLSPASSTAHLSVLSVLSDSESSCNIQDQYGHVYSYYAPMAYPTPVSTPDIDEQNGEDTLKDDVPTPSATLFVSNFDHHATEDDLNSVFSRCPGFQKLNMVSGDVPSAFVDFRDAECAKAALERHQGSSFAWATHGGGIHIEYAKQESQSPVMECSSPLSSSGTLSPVVTSSHQRNQSQMGSRQDHQPAFQVVSKDSVNLPSPPNNTAIHLPAAHFKHISTDRPSFVYPGSMFLNQPMIQPMW